MGLGNGSGGGDSKIISVLYGKFSLRVDAGTPGAIVRQLTKGDHAGDDVSEMRYSELSGVIVGGFLKDTVHGENALIKIVDEQEGQSYLLSLPSDSRMLTELCKRLPNIDPALATTLIIGKDKEKTTSSGGPIFYLLVKQGDEIISPAFTIDNMGDCPPAVQVRGKWTAASFIDQNNYLLELFEKWMLENGQVANGDRKQTPPAARKKEPEPETPPADFEEYEDDIPF